MNEDLHQLLQINCLQTSAANLGGVTLHHDADENCVSRFSFSVLFYWNSVFMLLSPLEAAAARPLKWFFCTYLHVSEYVDKLHIRRKLHLVKFVQELLGFVF